VRVPKRQKGRGAQDAAVMQRPCQWIHLPGETTANSCQQVQLLRMQRTTSTLP
jgi:hypothetical protein